MTISFDQKRALVSPNGRATRFLGIAAALRQAIASGRFVEREPLPSTRELAASFDAHRHTVLVALDALVAEGLLEARPRRGYYVCAAPPALERPRRTPTTEAQRFSGFRLVRGATPSVVALPAPAIALHAAFPDVTLLPLAELRAAYSHALRKRGASALAAAEVEGLPALRRELVRYVRRARGFLPQTLLVTHGSQEAIALAAQVLLKPGDSVAVEDPGYESATRAFRELGARVIPIPVDAQGMRIELLQRALERRRVRLVYTTPNHQYPTTVTLSAPRRALLLQLTLQHGVPILEDDYDHEYHYRGAPQAPLAASKHTPHVLYVGTLSKLIAPGVRVGFACGDPALIAAMTEIRRLVTRGNDSVTQTALATFMADGGLDRHLRRARRAYAARRDAALLALSRAAREVPLEYAAPDGGLAIWTRWPEHDVARLAERAAARGVWILPETMLSRRAAAHGARLAFGAVTPARFEQGLAIVVEEAKRMR